MIIDQKKEINARDDQAESYESLCLRRGILLDWIERKTVLNALDIQKNDVVLDAGCGTGRLTIEIAKKCKKVYALDFSQKSIEVLDKNINDQKIKNIETLVYDITTPFPIKEKIDKIINFETIHHIPTEAGRLETMRNFYNQLRAGGECLFVVYNFKSSFGEKNIKEGEFPNGIYYFRFTSEEVENLFKNSGFKNILIRGCVNFKGYRRLNKYNIYLLFYPMAMLDVFLSKFKLSCSLGDFLIGKGKK